MIIPQLNYKSFGDKANPACIVLLHGMLGSKENWRSQAQRLSEHFHVITPDLRNHGDSPHLSGMSYKAMAHDVLNLMQQLEINRFDLLGHSMGGKIAMEIALRQPETTTRLIIVDIAPKPYQLWHLTTFKALLSLPVSKLTSRKHADEVLSEQINDPFERAFLLKNLKTSKSGGYAWRCNLHEITRTYLNIANFTQAQMQFGGKTLFIKGEKSPYIDLETDTKVIKAFFPKFEIQIIHDAHHTPHIEKSNDFYRAVSGFLDLSGSNLKNHFPILT